MKDLNGQPIQIGDVIYRCGNNNYHKRAEICMGFTGSGNPKLSMAWTDGAGNQRLVSYGYLTSGNFVILTTPKDSDWVLDIYNKERKKLGREPLKKYGDT